MVPAPGLAAASWIGAAWGPAAVMIKVAVLVLFSHHDNGCMIGPPRSGHRRVPERPPEILPKISGSVSFRSCTSISAYEVLRAWREALLADDTLGHVGFSISMVDTAVEKVMVAEIGGSVTRTESWRRWSQPGVR